MIIVYQYAVEYPNISLKKISSYKWLKKPESFQSFQEELFQISTKPGNKVFF